MKRKLFDYNRDVAELRQYHGIKVCVNNAKKNFSVNPKKRIIDINTAFWTNCTTSQKAFVLEWCRRYIKTKDNFRADKQAMKFCLQNGFIESEILNLFHRCSFHSSLTRSQRLLMLTSISKYEYFWGNFKKWFKTKIKK
jgi:hypothetical protein